MWKIFSVWSHIFVYSSFYFCQLVVDHPVDGAFTNNKYEVATKATSIEILTDYVAKIQLHKYLQIKYNYVDDL